MVENSLHILAIATPKLLLKKMPTINVIKVGVSESSKGRSGKEHATFCMSDGEEQQMCDWSDNHEQV